MKPVKLTEPAVQDLEEIYDYIALDNIDAAERIKNRLQKRWRAAAENPAQDEKGMSYSQTYAVSGKATTSFSITNSMKESKSCEFCMVPGV